MAPALLTFASLCYVALPWLVFAAGWLRPVPAAVVVGLLLLTAVVELRGDSKFQIPNIPNSKRSSPIWNLESGIWNSLSIVLLAVIWTTLSGAGGSGFQNLDWHKHNLLLSAVGEQRWPIDFTVVRLGGSRTVPLTYYLAYYLPAGAAGRAFGWAVANVALYAWTVAGVFLALSWFAALVNRGLVFAALLFPALSGLDVVGRLIWSAQSYRFTEHLEWWAGMGSFQYSSNTSLLFWVPQHALAGWILTGLVVQRARDEGCARFAPFALALALLWSPFVTLGLAPFVLAAVWSSGWRRAVSFANLVAAPVLALVAILFLASRSESPPHGWWFQQPEAAAEWPKLAAFYVLEIGILAVLSRPASRDARREHPWWWWLAVALLIVLPLYRVGRFNDFTMRVSIPALFVLWSFVVAALRDPARPMRRLALAAVLVVGAVTAANELARSAAHYEIALPKVDRRPLLVQDRLYRFYIGHGDSWFFRHLARPLRQTVTIEAEHPRRSEDLLSEPAEQASDGRVLVLDSDADVALTYGFELERAVREMTLVARHRTGAPTSFDLTIDGTPRGRVFLAPTSGAWKFTTGTLSGEIDAGWHELGVHAPAAHSRLDLFVLME